MCNVNQKPALQLIHDDLDFLEKVLTALVVGTLKQCNSTVTDRNQFMPIGKFDS